MVNQSENQAVNDSAAPIASLASPVFSSVDMTAKQDSDLVSDMRKGNSSASACLNSLQIDMDEGDTGGSAANNVHYPGHWTSGTNDLNDPVHQRLDDQAGIGSQPVGREIGGGPSGPLYDESGRLQNPGAVGPVGRVIGGGPDGPLCDDHDRLLNPGAQGPVGRVINTGPKGRVVQYPGDEGSSNGASTVKWPGALSRASDLVNDPLLRSIDNKNPPTDSRSLKSVAYNIPASDAAPAVGPPKGRVVPGNHNLRPGAGGDNTGSGGTPSEPKPQPATGDDTRTIDPAPTRRPSPVTNSPVEVGRRPRGISPMKP
ncbi:MAG: hypothetical protein K2X93_13175 [Candidatus Obscuribacterales bacterium]|nr:hypothetical protein [Candidatus Obscuribacterales bacterium]